jgi:hypothetical protein
MQRSTKDCNEQPDAPQRNGGKKCPKTTEINEAFLLKNQ